MFRGWIARDASLSGSPLVTYLGGMRRGFTGIASWTYPLVRLTIYEDGLELGPSVSILKALVPILEGAIRGHFGCGGSWWHPTRFFCEPRESCRPV